jgi:hypothetical protein
VAKTKDIVEELRFISDRLSTQVRMLALGLLAVSWTILVGESAFLRKLSVDLGNSLLLISALSVFVLLLDFLQYVIGYVNAKKELDAAEAKGSTDVTFDPGRFTYRLRTLLFWTKQIVLVATLVMFLSVLIRYIRC